MSEHEGLRVIVGDGFTPPVRRREPPRRTRFCGHLHVELDHQIRRVSCVDCGDEVDAFSALCMVEHELNKWEERSAHAEREARKLEARVEELKREERNAKARVRRLPR